MTTHHHFLTKTIIISHNGQNVTNKNDITATPSGKDVYPDNTYQYVPLDKSRVNILHQTTDRVHDIKYDPNLEQKSNRIRVADISIDLFLDPLLREINHVVGKC